MKIAILTPTRGRPSGLMRLYDSIASTISGNNRIVFVYYIDDDDEKLTEYKQLRFKKHKSIQVIHYYGERQIIAKTFNFMTAQFKSKNMYFMNGADDMIFNTQGWDDILSRKLTEHPYSLYYFDDGIQHEGLATFAVISQQWISLMGYFFPEEIRHNYIDTYIFDVAKRAGTLVYIPEVKLTHFHFTIDNSLYDQTYAEAEQHWGVDAEAYNNSTDKRIAEAQRIKEKII